MNLPRKDLVATVAVALAAVVYLLWALDATVLGVDDARIAGVAVLVLGFVASAFAVVPGFDGLIHGNKTYLAITALLGLVAFGAGVWVLVTSEGLALTGVAAATLVLWAIATTHHALLTRNAPTPARVVPRPLVGSHRH